MQKLAKNILTIGPLGYFPGSGTIGSLVGLILLFLISYLNLKLQLFFILFFCFFSFCLIKILKNSFNSNDPSEIIIDEVVGVLVAFFGVQLSWINLLVGFLVFRFIDISKCLGLSYCEKYFKGPAGILLDDILAGIITNIFLNLFFT